VSDLAGLVDGHPSGRVDQREFLGLFVGIELGACALSALLTDAPAGARQVDITAGLTKLKTRLDATVDKCRDTTDLLGCRFEGLSPDPACLGLAVQLTNATFGIE